MSEQNERKDRVIEGREKRKITNNYPLPLISDTVENISTKRVFNKLNLQ